MMNPQMTGLPSEFSSDYLSSNGISAGAVFAFAYFALTNKKVDTKLFRTMSMLNHYQVDLMNNTLQKYDKWNAPGKTGGISFAGLDAEPL